MFQIPPEKMVAGAKSPERYFARQEMHICWDSGGPSSKSTQASIGGSVVIEVQMNGTCIPTRSGDRS